MPELSNKSRSNAFKFVKSLLNDGFDGTDVHKLMGELNTHLGEDIGGQILLDLLRNTDADDSDIKKHSTWFGPFPARLFNLAMREWYNYCDKYDIKEARFRFGDTKEWKDFRKQDTVDPLSDEQYEEMEQSAINQLLVFEWESDDVIARDVYKAINKLYKELQKLKHK